MTPQEKARLLRPFIEKAVTSLDDKDASQAVELSPAYPNDGSLVQAGTRINWNGELYRAAVDLWATEQNNPDNAPTIWNKIAYRDGIRIIPEAIYVGQEFSKGERGWWNNLIYESLVDGNIYTPDQYLAWWQKIEGSQYENYYADGTPIS